ncbi:hypothetical protein H2201_008797 [Coniosporium apollinis]|uniref:Cyanovirin-N domain-containing protein n=2 Tax=Coniosporium TaxID=2810619 RepID=A0ABQ9NJG2_9PEZI|nr:hypothetical protein H2199_004017 [Cladosporium sp. JES 115]KAJ9655452.1 hypothetical protein H2201_008797 [Coniosporium apollinis]
MKIPAAHLATTVVLLFSSAGAVLAAGCILPPCGEVYNNSPWTMKWADFSGGKDYCDVYNWNGGEGQSFAHKKCTQNWLAAGGHKGGWSHDRIDVDGFCFHDRSYRIRYLDGLSFTLEKGIWTKISSAQTAYCSKAVDGKPSCAIA